MLLAASISVDPEEGMSWHGKRDEQWQRPRWVRRWRL
jgi:hypothetical protein